MTASRSTKKAASEKSLSNPLISVRKITKVLLGETKLQPPKKHVPPEPTLDEATLIKAYNKAYKGNPYAFWNVDNDHKLDVYAARVLIEALEDEGVCFMYDDGEP